MPAAELTRIARSLGAVDEDPSQYEPILERIGDASIVMIGEASHGTHEFYGARAALTARLIVERNFAAVVAEADWPDAYRVNRFVRGDGSDTSAVEALDDFRRFPTWMWRNRVVERFVSWLRAHNHGRRPDQQAGFYGMDL